MATLTFHELKFGYMNRIEVNLTNDKNSYVYKHFWEKSICKFSYSYNCVKSSNSDIIFSEGKETLHIRWRKPTLYAKKNQLSLVAIN